jgi:hypothetical protein
MAASRSRFQARKTRPTTSSRYGDNEEEDEAVQEEMPDVPVQRSRRIASTKERKSSIK